MSDNIFQPHFLIDDTAHVRIMIDYRSQVYSHRYGPDIS
jgi:hypothetical protein